MTAKIDRYIPALRFLWLTPLYDPVLKWVMQEEQFKHRLIAQANIQAGQCILDLGCGTGTLTVMIKKLHPQAEVFGMDGDLDVLSIAKAKANRANIAITWDHGLADQLSYPDARFDRVISSLMIHHLARDQKRAAFSEVLRVLRPGGEFHIVDFGPPHSPAMRVVAQIMRRMEQTADNFDGLLTGFLSDAGFDSVAEIGSMPNILGPLSFYRGLKTMQGDVS